jgi:hypothetical protein
MNDESNTLFYTSVPNSEINASANLAFNVSLKSFSKTISYCSHCWLTMLVCSKRM